MQLTVSDCHRYEARPPVPTLSSGKKLQVPAKSPQGETIIYSFGVNDESTFEAEMLARIPSAQIYAFDFSVDKFGPQLSPSHASRAHFFKVGLGAKNEPNKSPAFYRLSGLMLMNNHSYIDILKIDVEGAEFDALDAFMDDCMATGVMPVGQVMIEIHLFEGIQFDRFEKWWRRLEGFGMRPTWLEINLMAITLGEGKTNPTCVEYVWVNAKDEKSLLWME